MTFVGCSRQSCAALAVCHVHVSAGLQQQADNLYTARSNCSYENLVLVGASLQQQADNLCMTCNSCRFLLAQSSSSRRTISTKPLSDAIIQSCVTVVVLNLMACASHQQQPDDLYMTLVGCPHHNSAADIVCQILVGAGLQQQTNDFDMARSSCTCQSRVNRRFLPDPCWHHPQAASERSQHDLVRMPLSDQCGPRCLPRPCWRRPQAASGRAWHDH